MPEEVYNQPVNQPNSPLKKNLASGVLILIGGIFNILFVIVPLFIGGFILAGGLSLGVFIDPWIFRLIFGASGISFIILGLMVYENKSKLFGILSFVISVYNILISVSVGYLSNLLAIGPYLAVLGGFLALISKNNVTSLSTKKIISMTLLGLLIAFGLYIPLVYSSNSLLSSAATASAHIDFGKFELIFTTLAGSDGTLTLSVKNNESGPITLTSATANLDGNDIVWTFIDGQNIPSGEIRSPVGIVTSGNWVVHTSDSDTYSMKLTIYYNFNGQNLSSIGTISHNYCAKCHYINTSAVT